MIRIVGNPAVFILMMLFMMGVSTITWQICCTDLYDCTDDNLIGFWEPGGWVHFDHGVEYVPVITHTHSMSDPDTIKAGWSMTKLWILWLSFVVASVVTSRAVARMPWALEPKGVGQ